MVERGGEKRNLLACTYDPSFLSPPSLPSLCLFLLSSLPPRSSPLCLPDHLSSPLPLFSLFPCILSLLLLLQALAGFSNEGVMTVAVLFPVAQGVQVSGVLDVALKRILGEPKRLIEAEMRMMVCVWLSLLRRE